jgi:hypothetical protein
MGIKGEWDFLSDKAFKSTNRLMDGCFHSEGHSARPLPGVFT